MCYEHQQFVESLLSTAESPLKKAKVDAYDTDSDDGVCYPEQVYHQPTGHRTEPLQKSFFTFASRAGASRVCPLKPWDKLEQTTKERKASTARNLIETMLELMVPDNTDEFRQLVEHKFFEMEKWTTGSKKDLDEIMSEISVQYYAAEDKQNRIVILSLVANSVSYSNIETYIPDLTPYMYTKAKKFARRIRDTKLLSSIDKQQPTEKYNHLAVEALVEFITSPTVMIGLPFGIRKVKLSDGTKIEIPDSIRQQTATEIIEMYTKIIKAFDGLHQILDTWKNLQLFEVDTIKMMKSHLFEFAQYLRTDYRLHVKNYSRIADHCANFALSDPENPKLAASCLNGPQKHTHDVKCDRCEKGNTILDKIEAHAKELTNEETQLSALPISNDFDTNFLEKCQEDVLQIGLYRKDILEMKKHMLRAATTNMERQDIIGKLKDNEALITLDFAQKFLPKWHREKQSSYFGKKGISYHISHVAARIGDIYVQHSFVHIYEGSISQDSQVVVLTMAHFLKELKKVGIEKVFLRSDNAGAYHSASTIGSLHWLMAESGVKIGSYSFSEAQNGKSSSDRDANRVKRRVKDYINQGHDVTTSEEFFKALENNPPNGISVYQGSVIVSKEGETKWPGISKLNYFSMEDNGIRARRYGDIGEGILVEKSKLIPVKRTSKFFEAGFTATNIDSKNEREAVLKSLPTKFWYYPKCTKTSTCVKEDESISQEVEEDVSINPIGGLYVCPQNGCSASYLKITNLQNHILRGQHSITPERMTGLDYAMRIFSRKLEDAGDTNICPIVGQAVEKLKETNAEVKLQTGWALPEKQTRTPYGKNVITFLIECFNKGEVEKKPMNPVIVSGMMRVAKNADGSKRFAVHEMKTPAQITSYFSNESAKRKKASSQGSSTSPPATKPGPKHRRSSGSQNAQDAMGKSVEEFEDFIEDQEVHFEAGLNRYMDSAKFWTESDEFMNAIISKKKEIFIGTS
ncbi:hypothetical protein CAEBREN_10292 [Caenorhabditis brenneri]|uniref:C2H2-type domain-containing protein n=1 Tax=Caenorhabditis brenneri TaxID=135651 RepID=G0P367_CAEBE|nr:hypothetical protein CAEBREN_10292 [Caenorhabditis brenneri]